MSAFENVLAELESRESCGVARAWAPIDIRDRSAAPTATNSKAATTIYLRSSSDGDDNAPRIDELYALSLAEMNDAGDCPARLKALRRKFAWRLHPDRCNGEREKSSAALARLNSLVDAALRRRR